MAEIELDRGDAAEGRLPPVCIYCGAPATAYRKKVFFGTAPYRRFLFHRPRVALPVCARHEPYSLRRSLLQLPPLVAFVAVLALLAALNGKGPVADPLAALFPFKGALVGLAFVLFLALLGTIFFLFYTDIRCTRLTTTTITLANVSDRFVDACSADAHERIEEVLPVDAPPPARRRRIARQSGPPRSSGSGWVWLVLIAAGVSITCLGCGGGLAVVYWLVRGRR